MDIQLNYALQSRPPLRPQWLGREAHQRLQTSRQLVGCGSKISTQGSRRAFGVLENLIVDRRTEVSDAHGVYSGQVIGTGAVPRCRLRFMHTKPRAVILLTADNACVTAKRPQQTL